MLFKRSPERGFSPEPEPKSELEKLRERFGQARDRLSQAATAWETIKDKFGDQADGLRTEILKLQTQFNADVFDLSPDGVNEEEQRAAVDFLASVEDLLSRIGDVEAENREEQEKGGLKSKLESLGLTEEEVIGKIPEFNDLSLGKKLLVLENLQQLTLGRIHEEAQDKYRADVQQAGFLGRVWKGASKQWQVKRMEKATATDLQKGGLGAHETSLRQLVEMTKDMPEVDVKEDGKLAIQFASDFENLKPQEQEIVDNFNRVANEFAQIPEEWSFTTANKKDQEKYHAALESYVRARSDLLSLRKDYIDKKSVNGEAEAIAYVNEAEMVVRLNQFLNTHPDVEKQLQDIKDERAWTKAFRDVFVEHTGYFTGGYVGRALAAGALGWLAAPIVAAGLGAWRARGRAHGTLREKEIAARKGTKDTSKEAKNTVDAASSVEKLEKDIQKFATASLIGGEPAVTDLQSLKARIDYTRGKIASGLVNYGSPAERIKNRYEILNAMARAEAEYFAWGGEAAVGDDTVSKRLDSFLEVREQRITKAQSRYVRNQMIYGAAMGAGFALAGAAVRDLYQHTSVGEKVREGFSSLWGKDASGAPGNSEPAPDGLGPTTEERNIPTGAGDNPIATQELPDNTDQGGPPPGPDHGLVAPPVVEKVSLREIVERPEFKGASMEQKYAQLEELHQQGGLARWEDEIRTPEGSTSHDSVWASTRSLLKLHAAELGIDKEGAELEQWAETQTANLVKQLGLDEGGRPLDLVHNGDRVYVYEGADHKLYLRFEAASGEEAGYLPESKPATSAERVEAVPPPAKPEASPLPQVQEIINAQTIEAQALSEEAKQRMEVDERYLESELERHNFAHLPGHGPRSDKLELYLHDWAEAQGFSDEQADRFVDQIAGADDKLTKRDFIDQGLYDKSNHEISTEKLTKVLEQFRGEQQPPEVIAGQAALSEDEKALAQNKEIGAQLMKSFASETTAEDLKLQMAILERTMPNGFDKEILGGFRLTPEFAAMAGNMAQSGEFDDAALREAVIKFEDIASANYHALATQEGQRAFIADLKDMHPGWQKFIYDSQSGEMALVEQNQSGKIEVFAVGEDGLVARQKLYQFARPDKWDFDPDNKNFSRDILKAIFKTGLEPITTLPGHVEGVELQTADAGGDKAPGDGEAALKPEQRPAGPPAGPEVVGAGPEAVPGPTVEAGGKTPGEQIAEQFLTRIAAENKLPADLADGVTTKEELGLLRSAYLEVASKAAAGDPDAKTLLPHLDSLVDKYIQANPELFKGQGIDSHLNLVPTEAELASRMAEGPEWLPAVKFGFDKDSFDWKGATNGQTWTKDGVEYTVKATEGLIESTALDKLNLEKAEGQTYQIAEHVIRQDNGRFTALRIFARQAG